MNDPPPDTTRSHTPTVGVRVTNVYLDGRRQSPHHLLAGARVNLLDEPKFHSRNRIIGKPGGEPLHPLHVEIAAEGLSIRKNDHLDPKHPKVDIWDASPDAIQRRKPLKAEWTGGSRRWVVRRTGIADFPSHMAARLKQLRKDRAKTRDATQRTALDKRIREIELGLEMQDRRVMAFTVRQTFRFALNGAAVINPKRHDNQLGGDVLTKSDWPLELVLGGWDPDALCGYLQGKLRIPMARARRTRAK